VGGRKEIGMNGVSEVSAEGSVIAGRRVWGVMRGFEGALERRKSMDEMGGIKKAVV
jgi:hypothetical protein